MSEAVARSGAYRPTACATVVLALSKTESRGGEPVSSARLLSFSLNSKCETWSLSESGGKVSLRVASRKMMPRSSSSITLSQESAAGTRTHLWGEETQPGVLFAGPQFRFPVHVEPVVRTVGGHVDLEMMPSLVPGHGESPFRGYRRVRSRDSLSPALDGAPEIRSCFAKMGVSGPWGCANPRTKDSQEDDRSSTGRVIPSRPYPAAMFSLQA